MPLDADDRDLLEDMIGRSSLPTLLEEIANIYDNQIGGDGWQAAADARGIAYDVIDTIAPVVATARADIARKLRDGADLARQMGL